MKPWPMLRRYRWALLAMLLVVPAVYWLLNGETPGEAPNAMAPAPPETPGSPLRPLSPAAGTASEAPAEVGPPANAGAEPGSAAAAGPVDIFAVRTWEPPAPIELPPAEAAPPPPPQAPPLPFRYAGRLEEPGKPIIFFLAQGEQILAVSPGDLIDGNYRVGKLEGGKLHFLYRPMKIRQSIPVEGDT